MAVASDVAAALDQATQRTAASADDAQLEAWGKQYPMPDERKDDPSNHAKMLYRWATAASCWWERPAYQE
jgi:hypothetical protein